MSSKTRLEPEFDLFKKQTGAGILSLQKADWSQNLISSKSRLEPEFDVFKKQTGAAI